MAFFRKAVLASTMIAAGLASTTGAAFAHDDEDREGDSNVVNAQGTDVLTQANACEVVDFALVDVLDDANADANAEAPLLNEQGDGNAASDVPNAGDENCTSRATEGGVDSPEAETADVDSAPATAAEDD